jgi:hypothetical protein
MFISKKELIELKNKARQSDHKTYENLQEIRDLKFKHLDLQKLVLDLFDYLNLTFVYEKESVKTVNGDDILLTKGKYKITKKQKEKK